MRKLKRLMQMSPREMATRSFELGWGLAERLASGLQYYLHKVRQESPVASLRRVLAAQPFFAFHPNYDPAVLRRSFEEHFPGRVDAICTQADEIGAGSILLFGHRVGSPSDQFDWHQDWKSGERFPLVFYRDIVTGETAPRADVKRVWEANRQQYLATLGTAYLLTGNAKYADQAAGLIDSWIGANPPYQGVNWKEALEAALRLLSWVWTLHMIRDSAALSEEFMNRVGASIALQRRHIERHLSTYSSPNTHLLGEALGLCLVGWMLPELPSAQHGAACGVRILEEQLRRQVADDGSHREKSAYYHCYALEMYLLATVLGRQHGVKFSLEWMARVEKMAEFLMHITRPDGMLARFGDDDGGKTIRLKDEDYHDARSLLALAAVLFRRGDFKRVAGSDAPEEVFWIFGPSSVEEYSALPWAEPKLHSGALWFPQAQVAVLRTGWRANDTWLLCRQQPMGMLTAGHSHAAPLSFELVMHGQPVAVDPGTYTYAQQEWRDHFRSLEAHNCVQVDGEPWLRPAAPFRWENLEWLECAPAGGAAASGMQATLRSGSPNGIYRHERQFAIHSASEVEVCDRLEGTGRHRLALWLHFPPGCRLCEEGGRFGIEFAGMTVGLALTGLGGFRWRVWEGSENPIAGWYSPRFDSKVPAPALQIETEAEFPAEVSMQFRADLPTARRTAGE
jgi:hypothetical protein